jgi:hypothetical protein
MAEAVAGAIAGGLQQLADSGMAEAALDTAEAFKARLLLDQLLLTPAAFSSPEQQAEAERLDREALALRIAAGPDGTDELYLSSQVPLGMQDDPQDQYRRYALMTAAEDIYAAGQAGFTSAAVPVSLHALQSCLQADEALVEYFVPYRPLQSPWMGIAIVTRDQAALGAIPQLADVTSQMGFVGTLSATVAGELVMPRTDFLPLAWAVARARQAIGSADEDTQLRAMDALVVQPLRDAGFDPAAFRQLVIVPCGPLHHLLFAALIGPSGRYLIEDVAVTFAPSASVWQHLATRPPVAITSAVALGNPAVAPEHELAELHAVARELRRIGRFLAPVPFDVHTGKDATFATLSGAREASIVHIAAHGGFPQADAMDAHELYLAPARGHDGVTRADEIAALDLRQAWLVALAICDGGLVRIGPGDEPYGLIPAFLRAGARNVLAPLWALRDHVAAQFMAAFYRALMHDGPAGALRRTAQAFIDDGAEVSDWAGMTLIGSGGQGRAASGNDRDQASR